jgi:hypothetical protein
MRVLAWREIPGHISTMVRTAQDGARIAQCGKSNEPIGKKQAEEPRSNRWVQLKAEDVRLHPARVAEGQERVSFHTVR